MAADGTPKIGRTISAKSRRIALICPTMWDEAELPHVVSHGGYEVQPYGADVSEHPEDFDVLGFIEDAVAEFREAKIDGVVASDDYPRSIVAAAIARRLNLPGPSAATILPCQHKYYSRIAQHKVLPEAVPSFALLRTDGRRAVWSWFDSASDATPSSLVRMSGLSAMSCTKLRTSGCGIASGAA